MKVAEKFEHYLITNYTRNVKGHLTAKNAVDFGAINVGDSILGVIVGQLDSSSSI